MSLQIIVSDCDMSDAVHAGGDVLRSAKVFTVEAPELEAYLRENRDAVENGKRTKQWAYWTRQVISVEPTP